jgi:hypothetical protein
MLTAAIQLNTYFNYPKATSAQMSQCQRLLPDRIGASARAIKPFGFSMTISNQKNCHHEPLVVEENDP